MQSEAAASRAADCLLKGVFGVFDALMAKNFSFKIEDAEALEPAALARALEDHPVVWRARAASGLGGFALLTQLGDAAAFATHAGNDEPESEELGAGAMDLLREIADSALGGGLAALTAATRRGDDRLEELEVLELGPGEAEALAAWLGGDGAALRFQFSAPDLEGSAALLLDARIVALFDSENAPEGDGGNDPLAELASRATLSEDELQDILSGFDGGTDSGEAERAAPAASGAPGPAPAAAPAAPPNLDMILDIRLVATARLGRVEMPIGDILGIGPGSIIEVGHLVDEPVELLVNDKLIARGDVVVVDEKFGLRITEIVSAQERIESLR